MVVDLNFHKVIKYFLSIFFFLLFSSKSFSENFTFKKLTDLNDPWGSSFINNEELIITEKTGKIKIVNIISEEVYEVEHNLNYFVAGQGGLLDIIYQDNYLWISYSENRGDWKTSTSIAKAHPLKRLGEGKDSAALAKFLLTEDSSWVTGQIIAVDGGRSKLS